MRPRTSTATLVRPRGARDQTTWGPWHGPDRAVGWGSVTKVLTAGLVRALVVNGSLAWSTTAPEILGGPAAPSLTVEALVRHRSGLPRVLPRSYGAPVDKDPYVAWTTEAFDRDVVPHLAELVTARSVGRDNYSNLGYALLTRMAETVTGESWLTALRERVVEPLGGDPDAFTVTPPAGATLALDRSGKPLADWDLSTGPFCGVGGLWATLPALADVLGAKGVGGKRSPLAPPPESDPPSPHAWQRGGLGRDVAWHNGMTLRQGAWVQTSHDRLVLAHRCGGVPGFTAGAARRAAQRAAGG
ncbi:serine hydrolase domain-containing protein [Paraoerskovia marina]|uniref:serine hydrolase domain-containing protein n=1 Tax=Paraoerskovia marina TaxID=545619 RepID=UPI000492E29F|nr:serine hydrolase domain-containing protein [Paraoerskovia marina]